MKLRVDGAAAADRVERAEPRRRLAVQDRRRRLGGRRDRRRGSSFGDGVTVRKGREVRPRLPAPRSLHGRRPRERPGRQPDCPPLRGAGSVTRPAARSPPRPARPLRRPRRRRSGGGRIRADPARLQERGTEQADDAVAPALSADGRYLAFQGTPRRPHRRLPRGPADAAPSLRSRRLAPTKRNLGPTPPRPRSPPTGATSASPPPPRSIPTTTSAPGSQRRLRRRHGRPRRRATSWRRRSNGCDLAIGAARPCGLTYAAAVARTPPGGSRSAPTVARSSSSPAPNRT